MTLVEIRRNGRFISQRSLSSHQNEFLRQTVGEIVMDLREQAKILFRPASGNQGSRQCITSGNLRRPKHPRFVENVRIK